SLDPIHFPVREDSMDTESLRVTTGPLPASSKVYVTGMLHPDVRVPIRRIELHPTAGEAPVFVYDSSGPYTDPAAEIDIRRGLAKLRAPWIADRGDVAPRPARDGAPGPRPLTARGGKAVTQRAYARAGIITPEMEFVAIRENVGRERHRDAAERDGETRGGSIPDSVAPATLGDEAAGRRPRDP